MRAMAVLDPIQQFEIHPIIPIDIGGLNLAFTNSTLWMLIGVLAIVGFFAAATGKRSMIPGRMQAAAETLHDFISNLAHDTIGHDSRKFFPYIFTLFIFIFVANFIGLIPSIPGAPHAAHVFTTTSHLIITFALAMLTIAIVVAFGIAKHGWKFFRLFAPSGLPLPLLFLLVPIEIVSFLSRPISLAVRLFANMFAGHIILKLFAGFVGMMLAAGGFVAVLSVFPFLGTVAVIALEILVAALQAYVFAILTCIYLSDAAHAADH